LFNVCLSTLGSAANTSLCRSYLSELESTLARWLLLGARHSDPQVAVKHADLRDELATTIHDTHVYANLLAALAICPMAEAWSWVILPFEI
jgi:hypothetical protein